MRIYCTQIEANIILRKIRIMLRKNGFHLFDAHNSPWSLSYYEDYAKDKRCAEIRLSDHTCNFNGDFEIIYDADQSPTVINFNIIQQEINKINNWYDNYEKENPSIC